VLLLVAVVTAALVGLTPVALTVFRGDQTNWERLSYIGQTYGAASALLSALALVGIAVTLVLQARDTKVSREQGQRILHVGLLKMAMDNPLYRRCWGPACGRGKPVPGRGRPQVLEQHQTNPHRDVEHPPRTPIPPDHRR
jgi:Family of unknown function (DUF6082)